MNTAYLKYFTDIARLNNISKAAELNHIAQPAMSRILNTIEKEYGSPLFERIGRNIRLNANGQILYESAQKCLTLLDTAKEAIQWHDRTSPGKITICLNGPIDHFADLCDRFQETYPNVRIDLQKPRYPIHLLPFWEYDLVITMGALPRKLNMSSKKITQNKLVLVVDKRNPISLYDTIALSNIALYDIVIPSLPRFRELFDARCEQEGFIPNIVGECDNRNEHMLLMHSDPFHRIGIMLDSLAALWTDEYKVIPIEGDVSTVDFHIFWNTSTALKPSAKEFLDFSLNFYKKRT